MPGHRRHVDVAQPLFLVLDVPLALEDPELGPDGGVARRAVEPLHDLRRGGPAEPVQHVHDLPLALGQERRRASGGHATFIAPLRFL